MAADLQRTMRGTAMRLMIRERPISTKESPGMGIALRQSSFQHGCLAMENPSSRRAKLVLFASRPIGIPIAGQDEDDYAVYASYRPHLSGFVGTLKVVRLTDSRLLYPFEGADEIGPFPTQAAARAAAAQRGSDIVVGDLRTPEL